MFLCSWPTALITFAVVFALFLVVKYRKPGNSQKDRSKFTDSTCWFRCRGQLGFISSSSSLQNGSDYRPAIEHDRGSRQNLHSADPGHDRITQHAADLGGFRLFAVQEELADDLRPRHESTNFVHNFTLRNFFQQINWNTGTSESPPALGPDAESHSLASRPQNQSVLQLGGQHEFLGWCGRHVTSQRNRQNEAQHPPRGLQGRLA
jgi:hypothetical protein